MQKVWHFDLPKAFSMAIRPFYDREAQVLIGEGYSYQQRDLNPHFWSSALKKWQAAPLAKRLLESPQLDAKDLIEFMDLLEQHQVLDEDLYLGIGGLEINPDWSSVASLNAKIASLTPEHFCCQYFDDLIQSIEFDAGDIISLGCESESGLFMALLFSARIKHRYPQLMVCVARHHFENFSLLNRLESLLAQGDLFEYLDAISYYEEGLSETYLSLLSFNQRRVALNEIKNVVIPYQSSYHIHKSNRVPALAKPQDSGFFKALDDYWKSLGLHPLKVHYNYPLINNQCYYSKCTFCVQIKKHQSKRVYQEAEALERSIYLLYYLKSKHGLRYLSFTDEALRPRDLRLLVENPDFKAAQFRWNMRLIADANFKSELIKSLYEAGCREVLFGLETIQEETALSMVKVSQGSELQQITDLIFKFSDAGVYLILSMIYNFPQAPDNEDEVLRNYAKALLRLSAKVDFIFNQFVLFGNTEVFERPSEFGIQKIYETPPEEDLYNVFSYEGHQRNCRIDEKRTLQYELIKLDLKRDDLVGANFSEQFKALKAAHSLYYSSWGFIYREQASGAKLYSVLKHEILN